MQAFLDVKSILGKSGIQGFRSSEYLPIRKPLIASRQMPGTMIRTVIEEDREEKDAGKKKIVLSPRFSIRPATDDDVPEIKKIRRDMGINDVPTVFQTFIKLDPEGFRVVVSETGKILGTCSIVFNGDDSDGIYFGGLYWIDPKYHGSGIGQKVYRIMVDRFGDANCALNSVPRMVKVYKEGDFPVEEKNFVCLKNQTPNNVSPEVLSNIIPPGVDIQPYQDSFLPEMIAYDKAVVGFRRSLLLSMSCKEKNSKTLVAFKNGACVGFGSIKETCLGAGRVGPLYADDPTVAEVILRKLIESFSDREGFAMMTISNNIHANYFLRKLDCPVIQECFRFYKKQRLIVDTSKIYALFDFNFVAF